eukprot:3940491-Rhodomonas_salina.2
MPGSKICVLAPGHRTANDSQGAAGMLENLRPIFHAQRTRIQLIRAEPGGVRPQVHAGVCCVRLIGRHTTSAPHAAQGARRRVLTWNQCRHPTFMPSPSALNQP